MKTINRLSSITGYNDSELSRILNIPLEGLNNFELTVDHLIILSQSLGVAPALEGNPIILFTEEGLFKGVILHCIESPMKQMASLETVVVSYIDRNGERHIERLRKSDNRFQNETLPGIKTKSIIGVTLRIKDSERINNPQPIGDFFDTIYESSNVSVGKNETGYFFFNKNNERISIYFEDITFDPYGVFIVKKESLYGLADSNGNVIASPLYLEIKPFSEGLAAFKPLYRWGFLDTNGQVAVNPRYNSVEAFNEGFSQVSMPVGRIPNPEGLINTKGNAVIKGKRIKEYSDFCFVIPYGDFFIGIKHDQETLDAFNSCKLYLLRGNSTHSNILLGGPNVSFFNEFYSDWATIYNEDTQLFGLLSSDRKTIINCCFLSVLKRSAEKIIGYVPCLKTSLNASIEQDDKGWGVLKGLAAETDKKAIATRDNCGNWMFPSGRILNDSVVYELCVEVKLKDDNDRYLKHLYVVAINGKYGVVDESKNAIISPDFDDIILPSADTYYYDSIYDDSEWLNINGRDTYYHNYYGLEDCIDSQVFVKKDGEWYSYSYEGTRKDDNGYKSILTHAGAYILQGEEGYGIMVGQKIVTPCQYDDIRVKPRYNTTGRADYVFFLLEKNKRKGLLIASVQDGGLFYNLAAQYRDLKVCNDRIIILNKKYGLLGFNGETILDVKFDNITFIPERDHYLVTLNGDQGVLDKNGNTVIGINYKHIAFVNKVYYLTTSENKQGIFGIIPCEYDTVEGIKDCFIVSKKKQQFFVSSDGRIIVSFDHCSLLDKVSTYNKTPVYGKDTYHIYNPSIQKEYQYPESELFKISIDGKIGVISHTGEMIIPCNYQGSGIISDNVLLAWSEATMQLFSKDGKNQSFIYDSIEALSTYEPRYDHPAFYVTQKEKLGLVLYEESSFRIEYPCVFDELKIGRKYASFEDRYIIDGISIRKKVLGPDGNYIEQPSELLWMSDYSTFGVSIAVKEGRFGLLDNNQKVLQDYKYDNILKVDAFHYLLSSNDESVLIRYDRDFRGSVLQSYPFSVVRRLASNIFYVKKDGKAGAYRYNPNEESLELFLGFLYDSITGYEDTFVVVNKSGLFGCFDITGELLLEEQYVYIKPLFDKNQGYSDKYPSDFLRGNILMAKISNEEGRKHLYTVFSYKSRKSVTINQVYISVSFFNEYHKEHGYYIQYKDSNNRYGVISTDCSKDSGTFESLEICYRYNNHPGFYISNNQLWGYLDYKTQNTIPCRFNQKVYYGEEKHRFWVIENQETNTKQIYDSKRKHVVSIPNLLDIQPFSDNKWLVSIHYGKSTFYGLYDDKMNTIIPAEYDKISEGIQDQYIASVKEQYGYNMKSSVIYDAQGKILCPLSDGAISCHWTESGKQPFYEKKGEGTFISYNGVDFSKTDDNPDREYLSWGCPHYYSGKNEDGTKNIITGFGVEYFFVEQDFTQDGITILRISGKNIVINNEKELSDDSHEKITINTIAKYISLIDGDSRTFIDYQGNVLGRIKGVFSSAIMHKDAKVICGITKDDDGNKQYRLYSDSGELLNTTFFSYIGLFSEGFATCVINSENPIDKVFFKRIRDIGYIEADHGQWGLINTEGKVVIPMRYDFIRPVKNGLTVYSKDYKFGVINPSKGRSTIAKYKYLDSFHEGLCRFRLFTEGDNTSGWYKSYEHSDYGFIDGNGKEVIPAVFYDASNFSSGVATVKSRDGFRNQIDKQGNLLHEWVEIPVSRDDYDDYDSGYTQAELDDMDRAAFEGDPSAQWNID